MHCTVMLLEHRRKLSYVRVNGALATQPCCNALVIAKIHCILVGNLLVQGNEWCGFRLRVRLWISSGNTLL